MTSARAKNLELDTGQRDRSAAKRGGIGLHGLETTATQPRGRSFRHAGARFCLAQARPCDKLDQGARDVRGLESIWETSAQNGRREGQRGQPDGATIPEQADGQLHQAQVIRGLLVVPHQNRPAAVQPGARPLHDPAPRRAGLPLPGVELFLADLADVGHVAAGLGRGLPGGIAVAFIQTQVLRTVLRLGPADDHGGDGLGEHLGVVHVGPGHRHAQDPALAVDQQAAFAAVFPAIRGVGPDLIPPKRALP